MALFVAVAPAIAVEGLGPIRAMRRSFRLVQAPPLAGARHRPAVGPAGQHGGLGAGRRPDQCWPSWSGCKWGWLLLAVGSILSGLVSTPLVAIIATLVYYDGRIRQEGLDLQIMAADLARGDASPLAGPAVAASRWSGRSPTCGRRSGRPTRCGTPSARCSPGRSSSGRRPGSSSGCGRRWSTSSSGPWGPCWAAGGGRSSPGSSWRWRSWPSRSSPSASPGA